ncbi:DUF6497 family protein [Cognatishimia sp. SS12]|uniref:DUF6497 family protein n=1 Tax=Cognatishimia sp. SS12 TaxID=2979465 RepID=UPI00232F2DE0|nr:DUF6497 family protein [Cognatishimia sp. SS12]MDC0738595.1 DUF6497 family protein [Cognatishimia sp. SS12]
MFDLRAALIPWLVFGAPVPLAAQAVKPAIAVPSGIEIALQEVRFEPGAEGGNVLRLRYVAPQIGQGGAGFDTVAQDFEVLCNTHAAPESRARGVNVDLVVVSLSDRATDFGVSYPDATQYFEAFTFETDICIWEGF